MVEEEDDPTFISEGDSEITEWNQHSPQVRLCSSLNTKGLIIIIIIISNYFHDA